MFFNNTKRPVTLFFSVRSVGSAFSNKAVTESYPSGLTNTCIPSFQLSAKTLTVVQGVCVVTRNADPLQESNLSCFVIIYETNCTAMWSFRHIFPTSPHTITSPCPPPVITSSRFFLSYRHNLLLPLHPSPAPAPSPPTITVPFSPLALRWRLILFVFTGQYK